MHALARAAAAWLALVAGAALAAPPAVPAGASLPRIIVAFTNEPHTAPGAAGATGSRYAGGGYRVAQAAEQQARSVARAYALREVDSWPIQVLSMHCVMFEITNGRPVPEVLAALSKDARVRLAQPLQEFHTLTDATAAAPARDAAAAAPYNDPLYDLQSNLLTLGIAQAQQRAQGAGVRVALIDTGVDAAHPDLRGRIVRSRSFLSRRMSAAWLRHGTAMAGVIAAVANNHIGIVGIAPLAQLEVYEACWQLAPDSDAAACNTFTLAQAVAAALASGAPLVNLSIAGPSDPLLSALIEHGLQRGVTFVGPVAGADEGFPTAIAGVISAGGAEHPLPQGAFAAPAAHVLTLRPAAQYDFESGSSVAAAELTGVIALLMSASATRLTPATVASLLGGDSVTTPAAATADPSPVDVNAALTRLDARQHRAAVAASALH
jgi:subtilisin family serine protease